jgi:hypothetical protein
MLRQWVMRRQILSYRDSIVPSEYGSLRFATISQSPSFLVALPDPRFAPRLGNSKPYTVALAIR